MLARFDSLMVLEVLKTELHLEGWLSGIVATKVAKASSLMVIMVEWLVKLAAKVGIETEWKEVEVIKPLVRLVVVGLVENRLVVAGLDENNWLNNWL